MRENRSKEIWSIRLRTMEKHLWGLWGCSAPPQGCCAYWGCCWEPRTGRRRDRVPAVSPGFLWEVLVGQLPVSQEGWSSELHQGHLHWGIEEYREEYCGQLLWASEYVHQAWPLVVQETRAWVSVFVRPKNHEPPGLTNYNTGEKYSLPADKPAYDVEGLANKIMPKEKVWRWHAKTHA